MTLLKNLIKRILKLSILEKMGISLVNFDLLKYTNHYKWVFKPFKIPTQKITFYPKKNIEESDIEICGRLIDAYRAATNNEPTTRDAENRHWPMVIQDNYQNLTLSLQSEDPRNLALTLSSMFKESFVSGIASGDLVKHSYSKIGKKIWSMKYQDNVLALAEYLGVVRTESPQQGMSAEGLKMGMDELVQMIETRVNTSLGFPDVGSPYGVVANGSLITMEHPEHFYVALRIHEAVEKYLSETRGTNLNIMEIGCGFGGLAYCISKQERIDVEKYTLVDIPVVNVIQGYFLSKVFDSSNVQLYEERPGESTIFHVIPPQAIDSFDGTLDLLVNENSMPEMSNGIVEDYLRFARKKVKGIFFSYNHEAFAPEFGIYQVLVPEIVDLVGGFERVSRNISWVRNGYVEEIYRVT